MLLNILFKLSEKNTEKTTICVPSSTILFINIVSNEQKIARFQDQMKINIVAPFSKFSKLNKTKFEMQ